MVSGGGSSGSAQGETGTSSSLSFIPALLANAFFGTGIGLGDGGFITTGLGDFNSLGRIKDTTNSSIIDPFGLPGSEISESSFGFPAGNTFLEKALGNSEPFNAGSQPVIDFGAGSQVGGFGGEGQSNTLLNPFDLLSNITDLANPGINPAVGGAFQGLQLSELGGLLGNNLLLGDIPSTLQEGLQTGFKPDLQPVIDEAQRSFFEDIVPQLGQNNVALQEGVGPFSTDLSGQLLNAGGAISSQLGALEVENQNRAGDRRGELLGLSSLITDQLFNANTDASRNRLNLGEQLAQQGTTGGRQATLLQLLSGITPTAPIQSSSQSSSSKGANFGVLGG